MTLRTRLCVVLHAQEVERTTNTGSVAARLVQGSDLLVHGLRTREDGVVRDSKVPAPDFAGRRPLVLFPTDDAEVLTAEHGAGDPVTLVVPDGTWTQARRMHNRVAWMSDLPHVTLPTSDRKSGYVLRAVTRDGGLSTMEAIAVALGLLEGDGVRDELERVFRLLVARTMAARGTPI